MTGEELKQIVRKSGLSVTDFARELDMSPQNLNSKFISKSIKLDFLKKVENVINRCCPPLPVEVEMAVNGSGVITNSPNANNYLGGDAALLAENKLLRQQNEYLQKQLDRCMEKLLG